MCYDLIQTITGILGLFSILLLWWQIKGESKWNKLNCSLDKIDSQLLLDNGNIISDAGIDMSDDIMSDEDFAKLTDEANVKILFKARDILDMLEDFSTLYNMDVLNKHFSYESYSENIIFFYSKFKKIIEFYREKYDGFYYTNLEKCFYKFSKIKQKEQKNIVKRTEKFNKLKQKTEAKLAKLQSDVKFKSSIFKDKFK